MLRQIISQPRFCIGAYTAIFIVIWLTGWVSNAIFSTQFDLNGLRDIYIWIMSQLNATHAINSIWNNKGEWAPGNQENKPD
jgi:hypothetical protein